MKKKKKRKIAAKLAKAFMAMTRDERRKLKHALIEAYKRD